MARSELFHDSLMRVWPLGRFIYRLANQRGLRRLSSVFIRAMRSEAIIIPINETISNPDSVVLPYPMLAPLIESTRARFLMNECLCRCGDKCGDYPHDLGCLYLGEGAAQISPRRGQLVDRDDAIAHVEDAMRLGLVPLVVHTTFDALTLGIPYKRMLGICFCCDCCCTVRQGLRLGPPAFWDIVVRLPGLAVEVNGTCSGCGSCVDSCYVKAISIGGGRAQIDTGPCKGCGRCMAACPHDAIGMHLDEQTDSLERLTSRITRRTDIGLPKGFTADHPV